MAQKKRVLMICLGMSIKMRINNKKELYTITAKNITFILQEIFVVHQ